MSPSVVMNIMYIKSTSFQGTFGMRAGGVGELILTFDTHTCHLYRVQCKGVTHFRSG